MDRIRVNRTSKCSNCGGGAGMRVRLGDESGPPRIAVCPRCDIPGAVTSADLPPGMRFVLHHAERAAGPA